MSTNQSDNRPGAAPESTAGLVQGLRARLDDTLVAAATNARKRSYSPYSNYAVGCALTAEGVTYLGANIENASYGLTVCAERTAVAAAVMAGARAVDTVAVVTDSSPPATPCGMCLQTLSEFTSAPEHMRVILANERGERLVLTLAALLPHSFTNRALAPDARYSSDEPAPADQDDQDNQDDQDP